MFPSLFIRHSAYNIYSQAGRQAGSKQAIEKARYGNIDSRISSKLGSMKSLTFLRSINKLIDILVWPLSLHLILYTLTSTIYKRIPYSIWNSFVHDFDLNCYCITAFIWQEKRTHLFLQSVSFGRSCFFIRPLVCSNVHGMYCPR